MRQRDQSQLVVSRDGDAYNNNEGSSGTAYNKRTLFVFQQCESHTVQTRDDDRRFDQSTHGLVRIVYDNGSETGFCLAARKANDAEPLTFYARQCINTDDQTQYKQFWTRTQNGYEDRLTYIGSLHGGHRYNSNRDGVVQASGTGSEPNQGSLDFGVDSTVPAIAASRVATSRARRTRHISIQLENVQNIDEMSTFVIAEKSMWPCFLEAEIHKITSPIENHVPSHLR